MPSRDDVLKLIRERVQHPASARELMQALRIPREDRLAFRRHLKALTDDGDLIEVRGKRYGLADKMDLVVGRLQAHAGGFGYVLPERQHEADVFIPAMHLKEAMHGDRVVARIERLRDGNRPEGRIVRILARANETVVGRYERDELDLGFVSPFDQRLLVDIAVPAGEAGGAKPGQMVMAQITRWPTPTRGPVGRVTEVLGSIDDPGVDTRIIIRKYGLPDEHGDEAVAEARRIAHPADGGRGAGKQRAGAGRRRAASPRVEHARQEDFAGRTDFRDRDIVTIDGETARDFDDAVSVEPLPNGHYWLGVHIADVSHYVREGSALDAEALERGTSVYFPERALHMFPEELATGLCSLNPHVDRLVQSCLMEVDRHGQVVRAEFHDGVIRTRERMTYTDVNAILTGASPETTARYEPLVPLFELMRELFQVLNDRRRRLGSIDFDLSESEVVLGSEGQIEAIIASERNIAHRIIEEFMLLANETVAEYLESGDVPGLYRVHEEPDPLKVAQFEEFIGTLGYSLGVPLHTVRPRHFQALVRRIRDKPEEKPIAALMLRTMQKARYAHVNLGHFGLAFSSYTHFTSPIRRYPDLVVHRLLRAARQQALSAQEKEDLRDDLPEVARHTSDRERRADEAERELLQWKKVRFMADKVGDEFDGFITGVAAFGLFVELVEHYVEGLVHVSTMADDYYRFLEATHALRGENTRKVYRLGDKVRVQLVRADMEKRQIELGLVDILEAVRRDERRRGAKRPKAAGPSREPTRKRPPGRTRRRR
ncbi:MAG TPA: ribonuclease R [Vicinamibacterales bacterium]|nr:ribonuclease R [Vicinamibacterales bacterium]